MSWELVTGERPLRVVIAGAGPMGRHWAETLVNHPGVHLVGWADLDIARAAEAAIRLGRLALPVSPSLVALLDDAQPDVLVNCTHPAAHRETSIAALDRGVHVLTEKPMAPTLPDARAMTQAADRARLLLMVSQNRRYLPGLNAVRDTLPSLGALAAVTSDFFIQHPAPHYVLKLAEPLLMEMAIHLFDAAREITGADAESVFCDSYRTPWSRYRGNDSAAAVFRMSAGLRYTFTAGWSARGHATSWTGAWRIVGEKGTVLWDGEGAPVLDTGGERTTAQCAPSVGPFGELADVLRDFISALSTGAMPQGECHDNLKSMAMVQAAVQSAATGLPVTVDST